MSVRAGSSASRSGRTRSAHATARASLDLHETTATVKRDGVDVVLVDIHTTDSVVVDGVREKHAADTGSPVSSGDEQHLEVVPRSAREADDPTVDFCDDQPHVRKEVGRQVLLDIVPVCWT